MLELTKERVTEMIGKKGWECVDKCSDVMMRAMMMGLQEAPVGDFREEKAMVVRLIALVTADKLVDTLGRGPLPVEVMPFAAPFCRRRLEDLELKPTLRMHEERPFVTDNFNVIFDCATGPIDDPARLERTIRAIPGIIDTGLFLGTADLVVVAGDGGVRELVRRKPRDR